MAENLNGDLSVPARENTAEMPWSPSPSGTVWRKRVHRVGPAEAGQVTSVVRYEPNSEFPAHDHPEGEEILVLDGVFSDEHGEWPAGTYLLNPEGFRHAPYSRPGCILFVKLRQFPGTERIHVAVQTRDLRWEDGPRSGIREKRLYAQEGFSDRTALQKWDAGTESRTIEFPDGAEIFVISGALGESDKNRPAGTWMRFPPGSAASLRSDDGAEIYVKTGGFAYLRQE